MRKLLHPAAGMAADREKERTIRWTNPCDYRRNFRGGVETSELCAVVGCIALNNSNAKIRTFFRSTK